MCVPTAAGVFWLAIAAVAGLAGWFSLRSLYRAARTARTAEDVAEVAVAHAPALFVTGLWVTVVLMDMSACG